MKTFYWSFVLMLLPSMAYTQTTEKENEFSMSMQIRPRAEYRNGALVPRNEGQKAASFINNRARLSLDYKRSDLESRCRHSMSEYGGKIRRLQEWSLYLE